MQPNEYKCAICGNVYTKAITDEEAMAETQSHWPGVAQEDCAVLCDDCYQKVQPDEHPQEYQESLLLNYRALLNDQVPLVNMTPADMIRKILAAYALPPEMLEVPINVNNTNIESEMRAYKTTLFGKRQHKPGQEV